MLGLGGVEVQGGSRPKGDPGGPETEEESSALWPSMVERRRGRGWSEASEASRRRNGAVVPAGPKLGGGARAPGSLDLQQAATAPSLHRLLPWPAKPHKRSN